MNLGDLDKLREWMLANGAVRARVGDVELVLGEQPAKELPADHPWVQYLQERAAQRKTYATPEEDPELYGRAPGEAPVGWDD